jgi:hypothetical protein
MSVPAGLAAGPGGQPASGPLEPEQTDLANGVRAGVHLGWLTGAADVFRRLAEIRARSN